MVCNKKGLSKKSILLREFQTGNYRIRVFSPLQVIELLREDSFCRKKITEIFTSQNGKLMFIGRMIKKLIHYAYHCQN